MLAKKAKTKYCNLPILPLVENNDLINPIS